MNLHVNEKIHDMTLNHVYYNAQYHFCDTTKTQKYLSHE